MADYGAVVKNSANKTIFHTNNLKLQLIAELPFEELTNNFYGAQRIWFIPKNLDASKIVYKGYPSEAMGYPDTFTYTPSNGMLVQKADDGQELTNWIFIYAVNVAPGRNVIRNPGGTKSEISAADDPVQYSAMGDMVKNSIWPRIFVFYWG